MVKKCGEFCGTHCLMCESVLATHIVQEATAFESFVVCHVCGRIVNAGDFAICADGCFFCSTQCEREHEFLDEAVIAGLVDGSEYMPSLALA